MYKILSHSHVRPVEYYTRWSSTECKFEWLLHASEDRTRAPMRIVDQGSSTWVTMAIPTAIKDISSQRFGFPCLRGQDLILIRSQRGTVVADDTGELVVPGVKSRKKDSDAESTTSRGRLIAMRLHDAMHTDIPKRRRSAALERSNTICYVFSSSFASSCAG